MKTNESKGIAEKKKIFDERVMSVFFLMCWVAYFSCYLGRLNFGASITEIVAQGVLEKSQAGLVSTAFFCSYGAGQLFSGILGDHISPRLMVFTGLIVSSVVNILMGSFSSAPLMIALWLLNGIAQSLIWSPLVRIFADRLPRRQCVRACVNISTSVAAGTLGAYLMSAGCIALFGWRSVFFAGALVTMTVGILWFFVIGKIERDADEKGFIEAPEEETASADGENGPARESIASGQSLGKILLCSGLGFCVVCVLAMGILRDGITTWTPTFLSEVFDLGSVVSILVTTLLPIVNLAGVYVADYLHKKIFHDELLTVAALYLLTGVALTILFFVGKNSALLSTLMMAVTTSAMLGINTMIIGLIPLYFARANKVSSITGLLNSLTYVGSALATYVFGALSDAYGWNVIMIVWIVVAIAALAAALLGRRVWVKYKRDL